MSPLDLTERQRRLILPVAGLALAAGFFFVFAPLARRAESLDAPLTLAWKQLTTAVGETNATTLDLGAIAARLRQTQESLQVVHTAHREVAARVVLGPDLRERMNAPFQLLDYQIEVQNQVEELARLAQQEKVVLDPAVAAGLPVHTADVKRPELLWAELAFLHDLLTLAIKSKVTAIHSLSLPLALTKGPPTNFPALMTEIPIQLELSGPMPQVARFLETLPRRAEELTAAALPAASTNKPALFIDRLLLRKQTPEKPDEVRLSLRAVGFVLRE